MQTFFSWIPWESKLINYLLHNLLTWVTNHTDSSEVAALLHKSGENPPHNPGDPDDVTKEIQMSASVGFDASVGIIERKQAYVKTTGDQMLYNGTKKR